MLVSFMHFSDRLSHLQKAGKASRQFRTELQLVFGGLRFWVSGLEFSSGILFFVSGFGVVCFVLAAPGVSGFAKGRIETTPSCTSVIYGLGFRVYSAWRRMGLLGLKCALGSRVSISQI